MKSIKKTESFDVKIKDYYDKFEPTDQPNDDQFQIELAKSSYSSICPKKGQTCELDTDTVINIENEKCEQKSTKISY